ncbi:hypothetical protein GCM10023155_28490 [Bremerella cremea]
MGAPADPNWASAEVTDKQAKMIPMQKGANLGFEKQRITGSSRSERLKGWKGRLKGENRLV